MYTAKYAEGEPN